MGSSYPPIRSECLLQQISVVRHLKDVTLEKNNIFVTDVIDMEGQQFINWKIEVRFSFLLPTKT
jgi:hypothetical protein